MKDLGEKYNAKSMANIWNFTVHFAKLVVICALMWGKTTKFVAVLGVL